MLRWQQMDYQVVNAPVEYYISGDNYQQIAPLRDSIIALMKQDPNLCFVHSDYDETEEIVEVDMNIDEANRLGVTQAQLSVYLAGALSGNNLVSLWEKDYNLPTKIYTEGVHNIDFEELGDMLVPTAHPGTWAQAGGKRGPERSLRDPAPDERTGY